MAVTRTDNFSCGSSQAGIPLADLRLQVVDTAGAAVGAAQSNGAAGCVMADLGRGVYLVTYVHNDGQRGAAKLLRVNPAPDVFLASASIDPADEPRAVVDAYLGRDLALARAAIIAAAGSVPTRSPLNVYARLRNRNRANQASGKLEVYDETDAALLFTMTQAVDPAADPVVESVPD